VPYIGCNAGFYAFELAARGAEVLAIDLDEHYLRQARWAAGSLDPHGRVRFERMQVYELDVLAERFDVILFLGVLYHLRYPLLALDLVAERLAGTLVVQTLTMPDGGVADPPDDLAISERERMRDPSWPKAAFIGWSAPRRTRPTSASALTRPGTSATLASRRCTPRSGAAPERAPGRELPPIVAVRCRGSWRSTG
jgi:SAM-dependent methyltransferase